MGSLLRPQILAPPEREDGGLRPQSLHWLESSRAMGTDWYRVKEHSGVLRLSCGLSCKFLGYLFS